MLQFRFYRNSRHHEKITPKSFEEALSRLESLTQSMQGEMPLEDALAAYQEAQRAGQVLPNQAGTSRTEITGFGCGRAEGVEP